MKPQKGECVQHVEQELVPKFLVTTYKVCYEYILLWKDEMKVHLQHPLDELTSY